MSYDGSLKFDTKIDESGFKSGIDNLGGIAKSAMGILAGVVAGGMVAMTKASVDSVAQLEQNLGGVETLFKDSADTVIKNAKRAYTTAGMSANSYMSTVTSFAASLLQSLSGDTEEAARIADMALKDMSDNANKMGTSMGLIENAYQGFAKQNYTMLDNLKLGYGGTKTEMERLLKDAERFSGIKYDIKNLDDVYQAIHVIQGELGITGATAEEAATTIEGSMNSAKAALDNFLSGAGGAEELADALSTAGIVLAENLGQIVPRLAESVPEFVRAFYNNISSAVSEMAPQGIAAAGKEILNQLITGVQENAPVIISSGATLISDFISGIASNLPSLVPTALKVVATIADAAVANLPKIINAGIELLKGLVQGIINSLPILISEGPRIINDFADAIYSALWELVKTGAELIVSLIKGIWESVPLLLENAGEILLAFINIFSLSKLFSLGKSLISNLANGITGMGSSISSVGKNILLKLVNGIKSLAKDPVNAVKNILTNIKNSITNISWKSIGTNIINGIKNGIKSAAKNLAGAAVSAAKDALNSVKKWLGIKSPSRRFRDEVGKMMAEGMGIGFEDNIPTQDMTDSMEQSVNKMQKRAQLVTKTSVPRTSEIIKNNYYTSDGGSDSPEDVIPINIHNEFNVDGKKLVDQTTSATIKKINSKQKSENRNKGVK